MPTYLQQLTLRLASGLERLAGARRQRHARLICSRQQADGGFAGREDGSDLYYTGFALRSLALVGQLHGAVAQQAAVFLRNKLTGRVPMVDFLSLIYGAALIEMAAGIDIFADRDPGWRQATAAALEQFRRADGGYAKTEEGAASSVYHSFLVVLAQQLIDRALPDSDRLRQFVLRRRQPDGGFVEMAAMKRSGTNPTAAAIGLLRVLDAVDDEVRLGACDFLAEMQNDEGGLQANTRVPIADLLSTFTGTLTLIDLGGGDRIDLAAARRYAESLEQPEGGFLGAAWDSVCDVEYTFYGLATLALTLDA